MLDICILRALFASTFIIGKQSLYLIRPIFLVGSRMTIAGLLLLVWYIYKHKKIAIKKKDIAIFAQVALFKVYFTYVFDTVAAQYVSSHKWALIYTFAPFVTAYLSWYILKESFNRLKIIGLFFGFLGFLPILFMTEPSSGKSSIHLLPEVVMVVSMISYSYGWIITKKLVDFYPGMLINGITLFAGGLGALITSFFVEESTIYSHCTAGNALLWSTLGIFTHILAYQCYIFLLKRHSATLLSFAGLLDPIMIACISWFVFSQVISYYFLLSIVLLGVGLAIFYYGENKKLAQF